MNQNGIAGHLLVGHGPELEHFERRDIGSTHLMSYDLKMKAPEITDSMTYTILNTGVDKKKINTKEEDLIPDPKQVRKAKVVGEFSRKCDMNYNKMGLRK